MQLQDASVLVVDDEPVNMKYLSEILRLNDYHNVHGTSDPREVCALCDKYKVDLIVLDINMPYMDGFQVMECLREDQKKAEIPVIIISTQGDMETFSRALLEGAEDFLTKPFDHNEILSCIRNLLQIRFLYKQLHYAR